MTDLDREALEAAELALHQEGLMGTRAEIAIRAYLAHRRYQGFIEVPLKTTSQRQDDNDDQHNADDPSRCVSPTLAVRPRGPCTEKNQDQKDDEDG